MERVQSNSIDLVRAMQGADGAATTRTLVAAKFEPSDYARHTSPDVEEHINKIWEAKCAQNPRFYNGSKFRLAGWKVLGGKWIFAIGLTCYKDLCGTNCAPNFRWIQEKGAKDFGNMQAYMSDPLGKYLCSVM